MLLESFIFKCLVLLFLGCVLNARGKGKNDFCMHGDLQNAREQIHMLKEFICLIVKAELL